MDVYGIIGKKLGHSFSPAYFNKKFRSLKLDADYRKFELKHIVELPDLIRHTSQLKGFNVTVPYKQSIIPILDELDPLAKTIGAVNTVKVLKIGNKPKLIGFNTDITGFQKACQQFLSGPKVKNALILGTGGSSKAVAHALRKMDFRVQFVSRHPSENQITYQLLNEEIIKNHLLIINTTPLGMFPETEKYPEIPFQYLTNQHFLFDLIYNPKQTLFLKRGSDYGARTENGLNMLRYQAEASWAIWQEI
jgi:shikimate dehydrogenase